MFASWWRSLLLLVSLLYLLSRRFLNDPTHIQSTREEWAEAFREADAHLGLRHRPPNYAHVFLDGLPRGVPR